MLTLRPHQISFDLVNDRLSAQLLDTTWQQIDLDIANDLSKLRTWSEKFKLFSSQQVGTFFRVKLNFDWNIFVLSYGFQIGGVD